MKPVIINEKLTTEFESKFLNVFEYPFGENGHYYTASRRKREDLVMFKSSLEYQNMTADAVTIATIMNFPDGDAKLVLNYEFRYATSQYILAPPAGLIDEEDKKTDNPLIAAAIRELREETGITVTTEDNVSVINPLVFSSPGMTDESNGIVSIILNNPDISQLSHAGCVGAESFDGFELLSIDDAREHIKNGRDKNGNFYSVYTFICLMYFVSQVWK